MATVCIIDLDKVELIWWFYFRHEAIFSTAQAAPKKKIIQTIPEDFFSSGKSALTHQQGKVAAASSAATRHINVLTEVNETVDLTEFQEVRAKDATKIAEEMQANTHRKRKIDEGRASNAGAVKAKRTMSHHAA